MKRFFLVFVFLLVFAPGIGAAQDESEFNAGFLLWYNNWSREQPGFATLRSDYAMLLGPTFEWKYRNQVSLEASYLFSTADYKFNDTAVPVKAGRQDLNFAVGYLVTPEFCIRAGYKNSMFKVNVAETKETLAGPLLGLKSTMPVREDLSLYASLDYLFTRFKHEDWGPGTFTEERPGWAYELGFRYTFTARFTGSIGYRAETNKGKTSDVEDTFSGATLSGMLSF